MSQSIAKRDPGQRVLLFLAACLLAAAAAAPAWADPCQVPEGPPGTVTLPPAGCDYLSPDEVHVIINGLPPGTTIEFAPIHKDFICGGDGTPSACTVLLPPGECEAPGGGLGGNGDCFDSTLELQATGTGALTGFSRVLSLPIDTEVHTGPRTPGDDVQDFPTEMVALEGQIFGDPDFDLLVIRAGATHGMPSPGHTTLTRLPSGNWNVDSFFDITYEIQFQGAPGSALAGLAGTTQSTIKMQAGVPAPPNPCFVPEGPPGTVTLPPDGCEYLSPDDVHMILAGLPPGTTVELAAIHKDFLCHGPAGQQGACSVAMAPGQCEQPGGTLSGSVDCSPSVAELQISGTGALASFARTLLVPLDMEVHTAPRTPGAPVQGFDSSMVRLEGQIFGDPDFDQLRIEAGSYWGLPSPGHTTLTSVGGGTYAVDSFFDIDYRIIYQGAQGGALAGLSGTTLGTIRMVTGNPPAPPIQVPAFSRVSSFVLLAGLLALSGALVVSMLRRRATG